MTRTPIALAFGHALKERRQQVGLTQEKLAFDAGIDRSYVSELENGLKEPGLGIVFKVAAALGVDPVAMVGRICGQIGSPAVLDKSLPYAPVTFVLGNDPCPQCNTIYSVHACVLNAAEEGKFNCVNCGRELNRWFGTRAIIYTVLKPRDPDTNTG